MSTLLRFAEETIAAITKLWSITVPLSYSLYLVHMPILYVVSQTFGSSMTLPGICISVLFIAIVVAELMARTVEFPLNDFGKRLSRTIPFASPKNR